MSEGALIPGAIAAIVILLGIILALVVWNKKKEGKYEEPNYRAFFIIGIIWLPLGAVFYSSSGNIAFLGMSLIFLIIGLANKDKWKEPQPLTLGQRRLMIALVISTVLLVLLTLALTLFR